MLSQLAMRKSLTKAKVLRLYQFNQLLIFKVFPGGSGTQLLPPFGANEQHKQTEEVIAAWPLSHLPTSLLARAPRRGARSGGSELPAGGAGPGWLNSSHEVSFAGEGEEGHTHAVATCEGKRNSASSQREQLPLYMSLFFF
jgi:hypothetical protein